MKPITSCLLLLLLLLCCLLLSTAGEAVEKVAETAEEQAQSQSQQNEAKEAVEKVGEAAQEQTQSQSQTQQDEAKETLDVSTLFWDELGIEGQEAAELLGYTQETWDNEEPIPLFDKDLETLTEAQRKAAELLMLEPYFGAEEVEVEEKPGSHVISLTASNFDSSVRDHVWLIEFYAPWCGHCVHFAPTYEMVAEKLHANNNDNKQKTKKVMVAKVNGPAERALLSRFNVRGYPTFFLVDGWNVYEYEGDRTLEDLVEFATEDYLEYYEPIPFLDSPFGPSGQLRAMFITMGTRAVSLFEWLTKTKELPKAAAAILLIGGTIVAGMFLIIFIGLMCVAKPKTD